MFAVRALLTGTVAALLGVGLYAGCARLAGEFRKSPSGLDVDLLEVARRAERLEAGNVALHASLRRGDAIRRELIEGRLTLREAAAALAEEDARRPDWVRSRPELLPGRTQEERWLHLTLTSVENMLWQDPRRDAVLTRLRAEFQDLLTASAGRQSPGPEAPGD
jgi:hypothetical protein